MQDWQFKYRDLKDKAKNWASCLLIVGLEGIVIFGICFAALKGQERNDKIYYQGYDEVSYQDKYGKVHYEIVVYDINGNLIYRREK